MYFGKEISYAKKSIWVSKAVSALPGKTEELEELARVLANRYTQYDVKVCLKALYSYNKEIPDIKKKLIGDVAIFFNKRMKGGYKVEKDKKQKREMQQLKF